LTLAADKLALRPIYVYLTDELCIFATNMRTLQCLVDEPLAPDEQGLAELVFFDQQLGCRTIYRNVCVLRPAELLTIGTSTERSAWYFDWSCVPRIEDDDETALSRGLHDAFIAAVRRRLTGGTADAFLSGGLDSRCVVAGLLDCGVTVRTLDISYPSSANAVIARLVAEKFGTEHASVEIEPVQRLWFALTPYAMIATKRAARQGRNLPRTIWGGDGGSVGLGHVYLGKDAVSQAAGEISDESVCRLFPNLNQIRSRLIGKRRGDRLRTLAIEGARAELERTAGAPPDRRLFLYYLLNDQMRHLYGHMEDIDQSVELISPFFDFDFLQMVVARPVGPFLLHHVYNRWLSEFRAPAAALPWQGYPGHEPCPHPMPGGIRSQWGGGWYHGRRVRRTMDLMIAQILASRDRRIAAYISLPLLFLMRFANLLGSERFNWEVLLAHKLFQAVTGPMRAGAHSGDAEGIEDI
jgi:hypothetical protein